ncbi:hypothetical protein QJS10_CPB12g01166 [Acorus calamus]|uniref:Ferredoxin thioredoxin reductase alpha chain domain-containing protein n=1 Tax=Acorus calamus TaxID=4465 RepID=A0AAV9DMT5_ACOCL|nr:hypothetical protein QJS10_CPB12g01166 [Acorus calamus]
MSTTTSTTTLAAPSLPGKAPRASAAVTIRHRRLSDSVGKHEMVLREREVHQEERQHLLRRFRDCRGSINEGRVGSRVRVKVPLKVYHVQKVPEVDLMGMEGEIKHYVGVYKGKRISANLPFRVQFSAQIDGRDVRFFAHLKEDEFDYIS